MSQVWFAVVDELFHQQDGKVVGSLLCGDVRSPDKVLLGSAALFVVVVVVAAFFCRIVAAAVSVLLVGVSVQVVPAYRTDGTACKFANCSRFLSLAIGVSVRQLFGCGLSWGPIEPALPPEALLWAASKRSIDFLVVSPFKANLSCFISRSIIFCSCGAFAPCNSATGQPSATKNMIDLFILLYGYINNIINILNQYNNI